MSGVRVDKSRLVGLAACRFGHDEDLDGLAEGDGPLGSAFCGREALCAVAPSGLGGGGETSGTGAVSQEQSHLDLTRLWWRDLNDRNDELLLSSISYCCKIDMIS